MAPVRSTPQAPWFRRLALVAALGLVACAQPGPRGEPLATLQPQALGLTDRAATALIEDRWWTAWGDAELDAWVTRALADSPNLQVARARMERAQALAQGIDAQDQPQLSFGAEATRQRFTEHGIYPAPIAGSVRNSATLQLTGRWEFDFFGRNQAALAAALGQARAAWADGQAAQVLLATQMARAWVALARAVEQVGIADDLIALRRTQTDLVSERVQAGLDAAGELRGAEAALAEARLQRETLAEQVTLARHAVAALAGQAPAMAKELTPRLTGLRLTQSPALLGADLLGRRADLVAARLRVEAGQQEVRSARAQFYPDVNLVAFAGLNAIGLDRLLEAGSRNLGVTPAFRLPLFEGGRLRAQLRGREADLDAAIGAYNAALVEAVRDASDAIASEQSLARQREAQQAALTAAESARGLALQRHRAGIGGRLPVLAAEANWLAQRRGAAELSARALDTRAQLMRALGGGFADSATVQAAR